MQELNPPPLIELRNATVMRGAREVLKNFSLEIAAGEHVAILGPNGCGKSTLIKTLTRECYPLAREDSRVRIFGRDRWDVFELRSMLGIVSNDVPELMYTFTAGEVALSGFFSSAGIWPHQVIAPWMRERAGAALRQLDAAHLAGRSFGELSSGEARRVLIARALVHSPKALLLDEPTTSLDLAAQHDLRENLRGLARSGIGIVLVTHHLSDIIPEIERVVLMKEGRVVADGPREDLLARKPIAELFGVPVDIAHRRGYVHAW